MVGKGTRFMSPRQYQQATALGLWVDSEGGEGAFALEAGVPRKVWDRATENRKPVLIRIQNISSSPVNWSENLATCNANQRNGIIPKDSVGGGAPEGDGGIIEFQRHIPKTVWVHCANAVNLLVTKRYADEN